MKLSQFSLSGVLASVALVAVFVLFVNQWSSLGAQPAFEGLLRFMWLSSLVVSYWKSTSLGWRRVFQTTLITGAVWTVCILGTHLMFVNSMQMYGGGGLSDVLLRAFFVAGFGIAAAFPAACALQLIGHVTNYWKAANTRSRVWATVILFAMCLTGTLAATMGRRSYWKPTLVPSGGQPLAESESVRRIRKRRPQKWLPRYATSLDDRFIASVNGPSLLVFDTATSDLIARLEAAANGWFLTVTFVPDSSILVAVRTQRDGATNLMRWNTMDWSTESPVPLSDLVDPSRPGESFPILVDQMLWLLYVDHQEAGKTRLEMATVDLSDEMWTPKAFASMSVELTRIHKSSLRDPFEPPWVASPVGACIVSGPNVFERGCRWVFRRGAKAPLKIPVNLLGFLAGGKRVVVSEHSWRRVLATDQPSGGDRPPFWDFFRSEDHCRVSIIDCATGRLVAQSRWWPCGNPYLSQSRTRVAAEHGDSFLVWDTSRYALR